MIPAQLRGDTAWSDVCIRNVSSHGMMLQMTKPPTPGSYVELRRESVVVVARVMWADSDSCGLRTQAKVDAGVLSGRVADTQARADQRSKSRMDALRFSAERAAMFGRSMQFVFGAVFGAALAALLALAAYQTMARPLTVIREVLG